MIVVTTIVGRDVVFFTLLSVTFSTPVVVKVVVGSLVVGIVLEFSIFVSLRSSVSLERSRVTFRSKLLEKCQK